MITQENSGYLKTGDLVIGSSDPSKSVYSATGTQINPSGVTVYGSTGDLQERRLDVVRSAMRSGGVPLQLNNSKSSAKKKMMKKSPKVESTSFEQYVKSTISGSHSEEPENTMQEKVETPLYTVQFENEFGRIKSKVEHLVEHEQAYLLIFSDEDSVVFEPKVGELLVLHTPSREQVTVYYPGVTFDSPDSTKKLMVLFKVPAEEQE